MAQYTTILAEEYNAMRRTMGKILGPSAAQNRYGYNTSLSVSSDVAVHQLIKKDEWENLKADINTARWWQTGAVPSITSPVKGDTITWANVVTYQNAVNAADGDAYTQVKYAVPAKFGYDYPFLTQTYVDASFSAPWGGNADSHPSGYVEKRYQGRYTFSSKEELIAYFNLGAYLVPSIVCTGTGTTTKDSSYIYVINAINGIAITWNTWWNSMGGSSNTSGSYVISATTQGVSTYSPYNVSSRHIEASATFTWNGNNIIDIFYNIKDYDVNYTTDGVTPAIQINYATRGSLFAFTPNASTLPSGTPGSAITKSSPTFSAPQGSYWY
jgi:hypothetical protein